MGPNQPTLQVKIVSAKGTSFEGPAYSISSQNSVGRFDILPEHANFITLIQGQPITINTVEKQTINLKLPISVIYAANNHVTIYTQIHLDLQS